MKDKLFYFLLFIVSITVFGIMVFSLAAKKGPYLSIFIPAALIYIFNVYERYETIRRIRQQRQEKKKYHNLRLSRK